MTETSQRGKTWGEGTESKAYKMGKVRELSQQVINLGK